jgi:glucose-6-phosphate isomerase
MHSIVHRKSVDTIMDACARATMHTYAQEKLEFMHIHLPEKSAFYLGQFMYMAMIETIYLAHLLNVNPFDQPEVERYKKATKDLL